MKTVVVVYVNDVDATNTCMTWISRLSGVITSLEGFMVMNLQRGLLLKKIRDWMCTEVSKSG